MEKNMTTDLASLADAYSLFVFGIRTQITRDYYLRRLRTLFDFIDLLPGETIENRCNYFAAAGIKDSDWAFNKVVSFLQFQKERVQRQEISAATLRNFVKAIKLFCEMSDVPVPWKKITRGLPKFRKFADDRAPTIEEIRKMIEYPDRRMKAILYVMSSSGIRLGAWDYLRWKDIVPIVKDGNTIAARVTVYSGDEEEYYTFITSEAYFELEKWMQYRSEAGEAINKYSWLMRQLWNTKQGYYHGVVTEPTQLKSTGIKRLIERTLWSQGIRKKSDLQHKRYEFQTNHGFRKWFKTRCELSGMKSINIEILMGHSIGISDSYYRVTEKELLDDYLKAVNFLTIGKDQEYRDKIESLVVEHSNIENAISKQLVNKELEIDKLSDRNISNTDAIAALAEQVMDLKKEIDKLKHKLKQHGKIDSKLL
jgi:integrase